jgi:hypothetical protein
MVTANGQKRDLGYGSGEAQDSIPSTAKVSKWTERPFIYAVPLPSSGKNVAATLKLAV